MKAIINSQKHIVQRSLDLIQEQSANSFVIASAVEAQSTAANLVAVGCVIKALFVELWILGESAQPCTVTWILEKIPASAGVVTQTEMQDLHDYPNKRNIFKMGQGIIGDSNSNPIPVIREWIKIPKGKQRMALGDSYQFTVSCIGEADNGCEICGFVIFKEYL